MATHHSADDPGLERLVGEARRDLAKRAGVAPDTIEVLEARAVVWPDAGAGCRRPWMRFTQVPVEGALIRLCADGRVYEYHSGGRYGLFLCEPGPVERHAPLDRAPESDASGRRGAGGRRGGPAAT